MRGFFGVVQHIIFYGFIKDARHSMHVLMCLSVFLIIIAGITLRGHLTQVAGDSENYHHSALYDNDVYSRLFQGAVAFTLIVALPTIFDMILSAMYLQTWEDLQQPIEFARRYIFAIIFIPNFFIYFKILPAVLVDLTMFFQYLLIFYTLIYRIHTLSMSQQKQVIVLAYPLRDLFINCIVTMIMGLCYKFSVYGIIANKPVWKALYTICLLIFQLLTCLKLKPWFNFTFQLSKVIKNDKLLQNKIAFYAVMFGILVCTGMTIVDVVSYNYEIMYFPKHSNGFIAVEWLFCFLLVAWTSVRNFEVLKTQIVTAVSC